MSITDEAWQSDDSPKDQLIHVYPLNEPREHVLNQLDCWCGPQRDHLVDTVVIHNSTDSREAYETGKRKLN